MKTPRRPCNQCKRNRAERFYVSARGRVCTDCQRKNRRSNARASHVSKTYGLNADEVTEILDYQHGKCAICRGTRKGNMDIDHDHSTGIVRGILCKRCNRWLLPGAVNDVVVLRQAIDYLTNPPAIAAIGERKVPEA